MATKSTPAKSTALPGVMKGSTVGTGTVAKAASSPIVKPKVSTPTKSSGKTTATAPEVPVDTGPTAGELAVIASNNEVIAAQNAAMAADKAAAEVARQDAFENLKTVFAAYGMSGLSDTISRIMKSGATANEALVKLKYDKTIDPATNQPWNAAYTTRFAGNEKRLSAGLNALSEVEYINLEDSYANTLKAYGLGDMLSADRTANEATFAKYIGSDISAPEFKDRIQTVEDRVVNADPAIKETFKAWYPNITDKDLVAYFLNPSETIGKLKEKATVAEIGAAAKGQGLTADMTTASSLAAYGVDRATALQGYQNIAEVLPSTKNLSQIYSETGIQYDQASGEAEFMKGNAKAAEERKRLKSLERASFSGQAGIDRGSLSKTTSGSF